MSAKRTMYNEDKANAVFAVKIRKLFEENGKTHNSLAEFIEQRTGESVTRQAVGQWCNGNTCPNLRIVPIIADFFGVSTDYLLTDTEIKTADIETKAVCEYTGLSEKAVKKLQSIIREDCRLPPYEASALSNFIESDSFIDLIRALHSYRLNNDRINELRLFIPALNKIVCSDFELELKLEFIKIFSETYALDIRGILSLEAPQEQDKVFDLIFDTALKSLPQLFVRERQDELSLAEYKASKALISIIENLRCNEALFFDSPQTFIEIFKEGCKGKKNISAEFIEFVTDALKGND